MNRKNRGGVSPAFTLIELLVVIAIIAILISMLLPSLGSARKVAWTVKCQATQKQIGTSIRLYLDDQKDAVFLNFHPANLPPRISDYTQAVVQLKDYVSTGGSVAFDCPAAKGLSSVRDQGNMSYLAGAGRIYVWPLTGPIERFTEFWFNDSPITKYGNGVPESGVSGRRVRLIRHPDEVVWLCDALDEFPRHVGKGVSNQTADSGKVTAGGKNNFVFGDLHVALLSIDDYFEKNDKYGAPAPFYNWGHYYPNGD